MSLAAGHLLHVDARARVEHRAPLGRARSRRARSACPSAHRRVPSSGSTAMSTSRRRAVADLLAVVEHRRLVLLALADHDDAVHVDRVRARRACRRRRPGRRPPCRRGRPSGRAGSAAASVTRTSSSARLRSGRRPCADDTPLRRSRRRRSDSVRSRASRPSSPAPTGGALPLGREHAGLRRLPRRGVGPAGARRPTRSTSGCAWRRFQSGLSWLTILRKREGFRAAFAGFQIAGGGRVRRRRRRAADGRRRHRPQPRQDRGRDRQRARRGRGSTTLAALIWSFAPAGARPAPRTLRRRAGGDAGVHGAGEGAQAPRLPLRRPDHRVRGDAGVRARQRPPGRLPCAVTGFDAGPGRAPAARVARGGPPARARARRPALRL